MIPIRRDFHFQLPADRVLDWHGHDRYVTGFINTLSVVFPVGERFFISAVRHYRDQISDPELQKAVTGFIGQEAMHGREHEMLNGLLASAGLPIAAQEAQVKVMLDWFLKNAPGLSLSATIALEHITALLGDALLRDQAMFSEAHPAFLHMLRWHALEETEHKAVAFDVWRNAFPPSLKNYALRSLGLLLSTAILVVFMMRNLEQNLSADPQSGSRIKGYLRLTNFMFGRRGHLLKSIVPWLEYFKPGFHPWDHDNSEFLQQLADFRPDQLASSPQDSYASLAA